MAGLQTRASPLRLAFEFKSYSAGQPVSQPALSFPFSLRTNIKNSFNPEGSEEPVFLLVLPLWVNHFFATLTVFHS
jgi:hypothetical protein